MRVLVIGNGAREHALTLALARSPQVDRIYCAPGNPGTALLAENLPYTVDGEAGLDAVAKWAFENTIDLTVVGPELALALGIVDPFRELALPIIGPTRRRRNLESSKSWARDFMVRHGIPAPEYQVTQSAEELGRLPGRRPASPSVLKADGLAGGKGAVVAHTFAEAREALLADGAGRHPGRGRGPRNGGLRGVLVGPRGQRAGLHRRQSGGAAAPGLRLQAPARRRAAAP